MILVVLAVILAGYAGFIIGWNFQQIKEAFEIIVKSDEVEGQMVNPRSPDVADVNQGSSIVSPKTPQQLEREAELELRKRNGL